MMLVRELAQPAPTCRTETPIADVARLLLQQREEAVAILNELNEIVGMVSRSELLRAYAREDAAQLTAAMIMQTNLTHFDPETPLNTAIRWMRERNVRWALIASAPEILSSKTVLTFRHLLRYLAAEHHAVKE